MSGARHARAAALLLVTIPLRAGPHHGPPATREDAYRANNIGVALLEQFRHEEAAAAFRRALQLHPGLALARANLAIALLNVPKLEEARAEARAAAALLPDTPPPHYVIGLAARGLGATEEAEDAFRRVLQLDPQDVGSHVNLGQLLIQRMKYAEAVAELRAALAAESYNATAAYNLGLALNRSGQAEEGQRMMQRFRELREAGYATFLSQNYPEQGRYAEAIASTGAEPELVEMATPPARFVDATSRWLAGAVAAGGAGGRVMLADLDSDGDLDVFAIGADGQRLYLNDAGRLSDVTARWGLDPGRGGFGAIAGDTDSDDRPDLLVLTAAGPRLLRHDGSRFSDVSATAGLPAEAAPVAALVDADHDGDLDVFLAGPPRARLLQNDGSARFKDVAEAAGLAIPATSPLAVVPTDFDNRRDLDLLVIGASAAPQLFRNRRDGTFADVAQDVGLARAAAFRGVAAGDVNKDDFTDFFFAVADGPGLLALSDGKGRFALGPAPEGTADARQVMLLDYDNDGLLDLVLLAADRLRVVRSLGRAGWADVSTAAGAAVPGAVTFAAGDLDADGDTDLVLRLASGELRVLENQGGVNRAQRVRLSARVSNRSGVGAKVEMRAGSLRQKLETYAATPAVAPADLVFGLGPRASADAVRVLWPAGILQTELVAAAMLAIKELDRKPSSCPYLYAWNGRRFEFVTDFMGGGEMGYWQGPGKFNVPDPDEYVRLRGDQLLAKDGRYEIRVTNELEEALFADRLELLAVTHAPDVEVFPDEGLRSRPPAFRLFAVRALRPPKSALDGHGHDVLDRLRTLDHTFADDFRTHRIRGYAEEHALVMELGPEAGDDTVLLLTGWTDYAFSSDNFAAHQAGLAMRPPRLEVEEAPGRWRTAVEEVGIPVGRPQTLGVPLRGKWAGPSRRVRLVTNMRIYWDQVRVGQAVEAPLEMTRIAPARAELRERGFSAAVSPDGREPFGFDYGRVSRRSPWKVFPGRYTRLGDVRELLVATDDMFVVSRPGDEIAVSFEALPPARAGRARTYLLFADGFSKEMDIHSASPDVLEPLPYHGMPSYPYAPPAAYPLTPERRAYIERYNTRVVRAPVAALELELLEARSP